MFIKLQDGNKLDITQFSEYSVALTIKLEELPDMVSIFDGNNVSEAVINDKKTVDGKENIVEIYKYRFLKLQSFNVLMTDGENVEVKFNYSEVPQSVIELAKQKAETEAVARFIALGLQNAEIKDVIKWAKFLDDWNGYKFPYQKGERFKFKGNPYEVVEAVTSDASNTPDKDTKHYKLLKEQENSQDKPKVEIRPWDEKVTYNKGDLVIARGIVFVSKIDNNKGNEPGFGSAWDYYKEK
jgi:hypothetical protein|nr:MAG TPA: CBD-like protein [Caudoviricetes sp.]